MENVKKLENVKLEGCVVNVDPEYTECIKGAELKNCEVNIVKKNGCGCSNAPVAKFEKVSFEQFEKDLPEFIRQKMTLDEIKDMWEHIPIPERATEGSAGYDFCIPFPQTLSKGVELTIPTGIRCKMNDGYVLEMYPRSGLGFKSKLRLNNTVGIIDSDYYYANNEGHIMLKVSVEKDGASVVLDGNSRVAQGIFKRYYKAEEEGKNLKERTGGFGSTGV